uniref:Uncharacterized protein n=1 Tax=Oryza brachyantha TaxID=4533 RepID=J3N9B1_ORYBR
MSNTVFYFIQPFSVPDFLSIRKFSFSINFSPNVITNQSLHHIFFSTNFLIFFQFGSMYGETAACRSRALTERLVSTVTGTLVQFPYNRRSIQARSMCSVVLRKLPRRLLQRR